MMDYSGRAVLVTGGAGFIGSHLVDALVAQKPASIHVVDNLFLGREENLQEAGRVFPLLRFHRLDASDGASLRRLIRDRNIDTVFNLATKALGYSFDDPADAFHVNTQIAGHLLEALRLKEIECLVHFSSSEVYGSAQLVPMPESHALVPHTPYAAGKAAADLMIRSYQESFGVKVLTLRPFNNYGPRQNQGLYAGVIPITMNRLLRGEPPVIQGTGEQTRDFIFVGDTARLAVDLARRDALRGQTLNLGSGVEVGIRALVLRICAIAGYGGPISSATARAGDVHRHCADVRALHSVAGKVDLRSLDLGLEETWEWYRGLARSKDGGPEAGRGTVR
jgi:UDP-glucose 4-epimerase